MKVSLKLFAVLIALGSAIGSVSAGENPHTTLDRIKTMRADKRGNEVLSVAKYSVKDVDPAKVDPADATAWLELFTVAQDYKGARTIAARLAEQATGADKFRAQLALLNAEYHLKNYSNVANLLSEIRPPNNQEAMQLARTANGYVYYALKDSNKEMALKILEAGEKVLPKSGFANDHQRDLVKRVNDTLAGTRKAIEENPGKELEAVQKQRTAQFSGTLPGGLDGSNTNAPTLSTNAFIRRGEKLDRFPRPHSTTNAPARATPEPQ